MNIRSYISVGSLCSRQPRLFLLPEAKLVHIRVFEDGDVHKRVQLMNNFLHLLMMDEIRPSIEPQNRVLNKTNSIPESEVSGIAGSVMQFYLENTLKCASDESNVLRLAALNVVCTIVKQGLANPLLCIPSVVAATTDPEGSIKDTAFKLLCFLDEKFPSFLDIKAIDSVRLSYAYLRDAVRQKPIYGYKANAEVLEAVLDPVYLLLRSHRQQRNHFLSALVALFDFDLRDISKIQIDIQFLRYVVENLAQFSYATADEPLALIFYLNRILSFSGLSVFHHLKALLLGSEFNSDMSKLLDAASALSMLITVKKHLQTLYGLTEAFV